MQKLILVVCLLLMIMGLVGCAQMIYDIELDEPIDGGMDDSSNPNAPKVITSEELTDFHVTFLDEPILNDVLMPHGKCTLDLRAHQDGALVEVECEESDISVRFVTDRSALTDLQALIKKQNLSAINGHSKRNTALGTYLDLKVKYASGETISAFAEGGVSTEPKGDHWSPTVFCGFFQRLCENNGYDFYPVEHLLLHDVPVLVQMDGVLYRHDGSSMDDSFDYSDVRGEIMQRIPTGELPMEDGQSNFGYIGASCAYVAEINCLAVNMDGTWFCFEPHTPEQRADG